MTKIFNNKGISIIETLMAALLTVVAIISLLPMQDISVRTGFRADYLGRAQGIMQTALETSELQVMIPTIPVSLGTSTATVRVSGQSGVAGDATFTVVTTTTVNPSAPNSWLVNVRVTWTGGPANGINSSMIVTKQLGFL